MSSVHIILTVIIYRERGRKRGENHLWKDWSTWRYRGMKVIFNRFMVFKVPLDMHVNRVATGDYIYYFIFWITYHKTST